MAKVNGFGEAAKWLNARGPALRKEVVSAEKANLRQAKTIAVKWSSGTLWTTPVRVLRKRGFFGGPGPYSRRAPHPGLDPGEINVQAGIFREGWRTEGPRRAFGALLSRLYNIASYSGFMYGTKLMIPRPIWDRIASELAPHRMGRLGEAVRAALKHVS